MIKINTMDLYLMRKCMDRNTKDQLANQIDYLLTCHGRGEKLERFETIKLAMQYSEFLCSKNECNDWEKLHEASREIVLVREILGYDWTYIEDKIHEINGLQKVVE